MPGHVVFSDRSLREFGKRLLRDRKAVILIEFAYALPVLTTLAFSSLEVTNLAIANMRVSQIAMTVADNLSRAKQSVPLGKPQLREVDINDAILGAKIQGGGNLDILEKGRIIVSSLQKTASGSTGKQKIFWQRCKGKLRIDSSYGREGATQGTTPNFSGMGTSPKITAPDASAIIFAEVTYDYEPLVGEWALGTFRIRREAAYFVRDDRDLTKVYNPSPAATASGCTNYVKTF